MISEGKNIEENVRLSKDKKEKKYKKKIIKNKRRKDC